MKFQLLIKTTTMNIKIFLAFKRSQDVVFIMLINVKIPTNNIYEHDNYCWHFNMYKHDQFHAQELSKSQKKGPHCIVRS